MVDNQIQKNYFLPKNIGFINYTIVKENIVDFINKECIYSCFKELKVNKEKIKDLNGIIYINTIYIKEDFRGKGCFYEILNELKTVAKLNNIKTITLISKQLNNNFDIVFFYKKRGFKVIEDFEDGKCLMILNLNN